MQCHSPFPFPQFRMQCHSPFPFPAVSNAMSQPIPFPLSFECNVTAHSLSLQFRMQCHSPFPFPAVSNAMSQPIPFPRSFECNVTALSLSRSFECNVTAHSLSLQFRMQCHSPFPFPAVSNAMSQPFPFPRSFECNVTAHSLSLQFRMQCHSHSLSPQFRMVFSMCCGYLVGSVIFSLSAATPLMTTVAGTQATGIGGLLVLGLCAGLMKAVYSSLGPDQFKLPEQRLLQKRCEYQIKITIAFSDNINPLFREFYFTSNFKI